MGKAIYELGLEHIGEKYVFGIVVPKKNSNWKGPWDCAEFASWCTYQATKKLYGCNEQEDAYTGFWWRDVKRFGIKISIEKAMKIKGAMLLRAPKKNPAKIGHIAISDGAGGTVEAKGAKYGVVKDVVSGRRWDCGVLVPGVNYEGENNDSDESDTYNLPEYSFFLKSPYLKHALILEAKKKLNEVNIFPGEMNTTFDIDFFHGLYSFQLLNGLVPDGELGKETLIEMNLI